MRRGDSCYFFTSCVVAARVGFAGLLLSHGGSLLGFIA